MKDILIFRHEKTDTEGYTGSRSDVPLSPEGRKRSRNLAEALEAFDAEAVYSSPMLRCRQTLEPYLERQNIEVQWKEQLRELDFGRWEGRTYESILRDEGKLVSQWLENPFHAPPPGGETVLELHRRVTACFTEIIADGNQQRILVMTHGGPIRCILAELSGAGIQGHWKYIIQRGNCCRFTWFDDGVKVIHAVNLPAKYLTE